MLYLKLLNASEETVFPLTDAPMTLGRAGDVDILIPGEGVSRRHARIRSHDGRLMIEDLQSRNGVYVNTRRIDAPTSLDNGDLIRLGSALLRVVDETSSTARMNIVREVDEPVGPASLFHADRLPYTFMDDTPEKGGAEESRLFRLTRLSRQVMGAESEASLGRMITTAMLEWFPADCCAMVYPHKSDQGYVLNIQALASRAGDVNRDLTISRTAIHEALENKMASITGNALQDERFRGQESVVARGIISILCVPLWHDNHIFGLLYMDSSDIMVQFTVADLGLLSAVANLTAIKIDNLRLFQTAIEKSALEKELAVAGEIQARLLPGEQFHFPGLLCVGSHQSCAGIGGDYYDFVPSPDAKLTVTVGDVSGHGPSSALLMVACKTMLTTLIESGIPIGERMARLNRFLTAHSASNQFITFFHAEIDTATGLFTYCNAGHNPPILLETEGEMRFFQSSGPPLGIMDIPCELHTAQISRDALIILYTDGITEAVNADGEQFEERRLCALLEARRSLRARDMMRAILDAVNRFTAGAPPMDDVTLAIVEYTG